MDYSHVTLKKFTWSTRQHILDGFHETLAYYEEQGFKPIDKPNCYDLLYFHSCIRFTVAQTFSYLDIPKPYPLHTITRGLPINRISQKIDVLFNDYKAPLDTLKRRIEDDFQELYSR